MKIALAQTTTGIDPAVNAAGLVATIAEAGRADIGGGPMANSPIAGS